MFMPAADLKAVGEAMGAVPYQERDTHYYIDPKEKADITIIIGDDEMGITSEIVIKDPVYFRTVCEKAERANEFSKKSSNIPDFLHINKKKLKAFKFQITDKTV
jgi:hypothetical protein